MNLRSGKRHVVTIDEANFESEVLRSRRPVLASFGSEWSHPCSILDPVLEELAMECGESLKVVKINADDTPELSMWYDIQAIPTSLCFLHGRVWTRVVGTATKSAILAKIKLALQSS